MKLERIRQVEEYIHNNGSATVTELCQLFGVSKNTIRRDIQKIEKNGSIMKVHGGVISTESHLLSFENRDTAFSEEKELIAKKAAAKVEDDDLIFIDSGTTTCLIPKFIDPNKTVTIITNNLDVITYAAQFDNFNIIVIGNRFKRKTYSFVEVSNWEYFERININKAFMAATGVSLSKGTTNSDMLEFDIKSKMMGKAEDHILLADNSKFGHASLVSYAAMEDFNTVITNGVLDEKYLNFFEGHSIELVYAED